MAELAFVEDRRAKKSHDCTQCDAVIGAGDNYKREAVPPWAFRYFDEEGNLVDCGDGVWIVVKRCHYCKQV